MTNYGSMFDSATQDFPASSKLNALYYNGLYAHKPYSVGPGRVWIDVLGNAPGKCSILQIDGTSAQVTALIGKARTWLEERNPVGLGCIYVNRSTLPRVQAELHGLSYNVWLSTLDGTLPGALATPGGHLIAVQAWPAPRQGHHADESAVVDDTWWKAHHA